MLEKELEAAENLCRSSGKIIREYFDKDYSFHYKGPELATEVDEKVEAHIFAGLKDFGYSFLGEETGLRKKKSDYCWIVDPLDGTTNFKMKNPFFNTSIALAKGEQVLLGVVYNPMMDELFEAVKGQGALLNGRKLEVLESDLSKSIVAYCSHKNRVEQMEVADLQKKLIGALDLRKMGAAALELCYVADNRVQAFIMPGVRLWDVAAGVLIVEEAGGKATDFCSKEFNTKSDSLVAAAPELHKKLLSLI